MALRIPHRRADPARTGAGYESQLTPPLHALTGRSVHVIMPCRASLLLWSGQRRRVTVAVVGSYSLPLASLAEAMRDGAWAGCLGLSNLGVLDAVQEHDIPPGRLALVPSPGPDWLQVM